MPAKIKVIPKFGEPPADGLVVDVTSHSTDVGRGFSLFFLGPCPLYGGYVAQVMENGWQFAKVFAQHVDRDCNPTSAYWAWATAGWRNPKAVRYPVNYRRLKPAACSYVARRAYHRLVDNSPGSDVPSRDVVGDPSEAARSA